MANVLVFGTSTTYGAWDTEGGWVSRLRKFIDKKVIESAFQIDYLVYNLGISGDKSTGILERIESETKRRLDKYGGENIFLLHFGINDCIYNEKLGGLEISPDEFENNTEQILTIAKKFSEKVVVIGCQPVDGRVDPMPWVPGRSYKNEYIKEYNEILSKVSKIHNVRFIDVYDSFVDPSTLLADGVHMNDRGHKLLFDLVRDSLIEDKILVL